MNEQDTPSFAELTANRINTKVHLPPVVRERLIEQAKEAGTTLSKHGAQLLTAAVFPSLAPQPVLKFSRPERDDGEDGNGGVPRFETIAQFKAYLLVEGIVNSAEEAETVVQLARHHFAPSGGSDHGSC